MIAIIDYQMGNVGSIKNMMKKMGVPATITHDPEEIRAASKLILPGVGSFDRGMKNIMDMGLRPVLEEAVFGRGTPVLGICLGMQLLFRQSEEGNLPGLGWIEGHVVRFRRSGTELKIPHMGWNTVDVSGTPELFRGLADEARFYFVHSYHVECEEAAVLARTQHGYPFAASVGSGNIAGTQFHPEKSHRFGLRLLRNFAEAA